MNIALIILDSVRKDVFDEYASHLNERADVVFSECRAASSWSTPSHGSMMTGELPSEHECHTYQKSYTHLDREDTFLGDLEHHAVGVTSNAYANSAFGFDNFFDEFIEVSHKRYLADGIDMDEWMSRNEASGPQRYISLLESIFQHEHQIASLLNAIFFKSYDGLRRSNFPNPMDNGASYVLRSLRRKLESSPKPTFFFANIMESHSPLHTNFHYDQSLYDVPRTWSSFEKEPWELNTKEEFDDEDEEYIQNYRQVYNASVEYLDRSLDSFLDDIHENTADETVVIVTADHGENLGYPEEDRMFGHSCSVSESLLHVPLLVFNAPEWMDEEYTETFSHLDLGELILNIESGKEEVPTRECVPAELIGNGVGNPDEIEESKYWNRMIRVVYRDKIKYQWDSLGDKKIDGEYSEIPETIRDVFDTRIDEYDPVTEEIEVSDSTKNRLAELGYL